MPHPAQPQHTNHCALRTRKRHQREHRPQRPTERSDPTQHAKGRTGDCPGPRKGATTRRNVTQGGANHELMRTRWGFHSISLKGCYPAAPGMSPGASTIYRSRGIHPNASRTHPGAPERCPRAQPPAAAAAAAAVHRSRRALPKWRGYVGTGVVPLKGYDGETKGCRVTKPMVGDGLRTAVGGPLAGVAGRPGLSQVGPGV